MNSPHTSYDVAVVGAGVAGLSVALRLILAGKKVILIEAAPHVGGRARAIMSKPINTLPPTHTPPTSSVLYRDNGPHLIMGAYHCFLDTLLLAGVKLSAAFDIRPFTWVSRHLLLSLGRSRYTLFRYLSALLHARGVSIADLIPILRLLRVLRSPSALLALQESSLSVEAWVRALKFSARLSDECLYPLCLSAMNTAPSEAFAYTFAHTLREVFLGDNPHASLGINNTDMLWPRNDLSATYATPILNRFTALGGTLMRGHRISSIEKTDDGYILKNTTEPSISATQVVLAVAAWDALRLLQNTHPMHSTINLTINHLSQVASRAISSVYVSWHETSKNQLHHPLFKPLSQWVVAIAKHFPILRAQSFEGYTLIWLNLSAYRVGFTEVKGAPTLCAIYSADIPEDPENHAKRALDDLLPHVGKSVINRATAHDKALLKALLAWADFSAITEKRATPATTVDRPALSPHVSDGLWLSGDYLADDLPGTIETAARSAWQVATMITK